MHLLRYPGMATDFALLDRWRAGDASAGNELLQRHFKAICRFFRNKVSGGVDDLIQRTFLACVQSKDDFRKDASFQTYLYTLARNTLYAHVHRSLPKGRRIDPLEVSAHDIGPTPSELVGKQAEHRLLLAGLRRIPLDYQVLLELYYWEDLTAPEMATILGVPQGTVRTRIRKAKALLESEIRKLEQPGEVLDSTLGGFESWARALREQADAAVTPRQPT